MKKLTLLFVLLITAISFSSCTEDLYYTNYAMGADNWSGGSTDDHDKAATYLIKAGYVSQFQLSHGTTLEEHNADAEKLYNSKLEQLKSTGLAEIAQKLKGSDNAPFTLSFDYLINHSSTTKWVLLKTETVSVNIEK